MFVIATTTGVLKDKVYFGRMGATGPVLFESDKKQAATYATKTEARQWIQLLKQRSPRSYEIEEV